MKFKDTEMTVGAEKPFEILHFSDIHLTYADDRDDQRKLELAASRVKYFPGAPENLEEVIADSKRTGAMLVSTGDLIDFVSYANLDAAKKFTDENDCFFAPGNHEYSLYVGEAFEDEAYRSMSLDRVQAAFKNNIRFASRVVNGVNLVAIDNGYYLVDRAQFDALKAECAKGLPVILIMHIPLHTDALCHEMMAVRGEPCGHLFASPERTLATYPENRIRQQTPDALSREFYDYVSNEPAIKAILAGHIHGGWYEDPVNDRLIQYTVGPAVARRVTVK